MADIQSIITKGEGSALELKASLSDLDRIVEILTSFANRGGGTVLVGVDEYGKLKWVDIGKCTIEQPINKVTDNTDPSIYPKIEALEVDGKKVIEISTGGSSNKPHTAFGKAFTRVGKVTKMMKRDEYEKLLLERKAAEYDSQVVQGATYSDISRGAVNEYKRKYEIVKKKKIYASNGELLKSLNCITGDWEVTNAGILLFGKEPQKFIYKSYITVVRYPDTRVTGTHIGSKDFFGNLFDIIDRADSYVREHIQVVSKIPKEGLRRSETPQYPYFAIREFLVNAAAHRDYSFYGSRILISMFKDRIEFFSPGPLPKGITIRNILAAQYSRNPTIARALHDLEYIEEYGNGMGRVFNEVRKHPFKSKLPGLVDTGSAFIVTLHSPDLSKVAKEEFGFGLNERQKRALDCIKGKGAVTNREYAKINKVGRVYSLKELQDMVRKGVIKRVGRGRSTRYIVSG